MPRLLLIGMPNRPHTIDVIAALRARGYTVVSADIAKEPCFSSLVEASLPIASLAADAVLPVAVAYHRERPFDGVARFHELAVPASNAVAAALGLPHFTPSAIEGCVNKFKMRTWMHDRGVPCPPFGGAASEAEASEIARRLDYPVVIKPQVGGASYGVTRLDGEADLHRFFEHAGIFWEPRRFIVERYVDGNEISVESVTTDRPAHVALFEKPQPLVGPYFLEHTFITPGRHDQATVDAAHEAVTNLILKLGLRQCITHTELRIAKDGPFVVEFGFRPIGYPGPVCVQQTTGVDLLHVMAQLACGEPPRVQPISTGRYCGWRYIIIPKEGCLQAVRGVQTARTLPGVLACSVWAVPGETLTLPPHGFDYIKGHIVAAGDSFETVQERLSEAATMIELVVA